MTVPQLARWSLTPAGHKEVKTSDQYPAQPAAPRKQQLLAHDSRTTEAIVRLIELGRRSELSGVYVAHELPLSPKQRRPVRDALVVMQFGSFDRPNLVPWSSGPVATNEGRMRFTIEADNNTEPLSVLTSKAATYRKLFGSHEWARWWAEQHGPLPIPLWVAPTWTRALAIQREWKRAWPEGEWLVTSDDGLAQNELLGWKHQQERTIALGFGKLRPAPPKPPPTPPSAAAALSAQQAGIPVATTSVDSAAPAPAATVPMPLPAPSSPGAHPAVPHPQTMRSAIPNGAMRRASAVPLRWTDRAVSFLESVSPHKVAWKLLCWVASLLWAVLRLPWRVVRWYQSLKDPTYSYVRSGAITLSLLLVVLSLALTMVRLGWLPSPFDEASSDRPAAAETPQPAALVDGALPEATPSLPACLPVRVTAHGVRLRAEPGQHSPILRTLQKGELLSVKDCSGAKPDKYTWWQVVDGRGLEGWVASD